ncbi:hypothetical protein J6O86_06530 [bacterium]|nr:hypothetical protein [bacterium]
MANKGIKFNNEDEIINILEKVIQIKSCISLMQNAIDNDYNPPEMSDIQNSLEMIYNQADSLIKDLENYRNYIGFNK